MTAQPIAQHDQGFESFIIEEVSMISSLNDARIKQMMDYSKAFLDKVFPLAQGSHSQVRSYVVYYQHLLAFFEDGTQSGLKNPKQFVALSGHKEKPGSIVLKNDEGYHIEIIINANGKRGRKDCAHIDDIQVETPTRELENLTIAANDEFNAKNHWFSMVRGDSEIMTDRNGKKICRCVDRRKAFTGKDGEEYLIG
jgi:malate synthase